MAPASGVAGSRSDRDSPVHEPGQGVDLHGVVAAVRHRHDDDLGRGLSEPVADGPGRALSIAVVHRHDPWILTLALLDPRDSRVVR